MMCEDKQLEVCQMKKRLAIILLTSIFVANSIVLTSCHTSDTAAEIPSQSTNAEPEDAQESDKFTEDLAEDEEYDEVIVQGSPKIVEEEIIPSDDDPSSYVSPEPVEEPESIEETPSGEVVCPQCNKVVPYISRYGICDDCYASNNDFGNCAYCGVALTSTEVSSSPTNRCFNCKDVCLICGSHGVDQSQIMEYRDVICGTCYMMYCMPCENCGKVGNLTWSGDGRILCPDCIAALNP